MKKLFLLPTLAALTFTACKKENNVRPAYPTAATTSPSSQDLSRTSPSELSSKISLSEYGYLQFTDSAALPAYAAFLDENEESEVKAFCESIGFQSQAFEAIQADNGFSIADGKAAYYFNTDGVVQIGDLVIRGVNSEGYLLVMSAEQMSAEAYTKISQKIFDPQLMSKLRIGGDYGESLQNFVNTYPGHDGTNDPVLPQPASKFFGWGEWTRGGTDATGHAQWIRRFYVFWIPCGWDYDYR